MPSLTEGPIARTLIIFSLPILAGNILQSLNGSVNAIWVGKFLGEAALTATSNANTLLFLLLGGAFGFSLAATILVAQYVGAKRVDDAKRVVGTSATFFALLSVGAAAVGFVFARELLALMATPAEAVPLALAYLRILMLSVPFLFLFTFVMAAMRGAGDSRTPFAFLVLAVVLDIVLNPLLIFGIGPLPELGIAGSALATLISQAVSLVALVVHLHRIRWPLRIRRRELHLLKLDGRVVSTLFTKGIPMGLQLVVISTSALIMITLVNRFGTATTAAYGAAMQLWSYIQMPAFAVGAAVSSMAAQNIGAGYWHRVSRIAGVGVAFTVAVTAAIVALVTGFNRPALLLFLPANGAAIDIAAHLNPIGAWSFVLFAVSIVLFSVVRATGAVIAPLVILTISLWVVRFPFAEALLGRWQADAIWWSFPISAAVAALLAVAYYRYGGWRTARLARPASPG
jgi:putative MATE family efflux protein